MRTYILIQFFFVNLTQLYITRVSQVSAWNSCNSCNTVLDDYETNCEIYWNHTAFKLLNSWKGGIKRELFEDFEITKLGHTPMWLRILQGKLFCVQLRVPRNTVLRMKMYRALHYINRVNRILKLYDLPSGIEWWSHYSDWVKVPEYSKFPPVFSISGASGYQDIAGIPFMSFSDRIAELEERAFRNLIKLDEVFVSRWSQRKELAYFRGTLSDCSDAVQNHHGNVNYCARAKLVLEASRSKNSMLAGIKTTSKFVRDGDLNLTNFSSCTNCVTDRVNGSIFASELLQYKYLIDLPGAGNWSRRMSVLMRAGGLIFQVESTGHQFYEVGLKPGVHYVPFNPGLGYYGVGNLLSRLEWAKSNDESARIIAQRAETFGRTCLKESSIDQFVVILMKLYESRLQGIVSPKPTIDLSSCKCGPSGCKFTKLCKETIQKCWLFD